jgi:hypothetical protein
MAAMTWQALLAPLPDAVVPALRPLAPPEVLASAEGAAIAGWTQLTVELAAGCDGMRMVLVILDADKVLLSASDAVVFRHQLPGKVHFRHESVGGRFEPDGRFAGTHWTSESTEHPDGSVEQTMPATSRPPSEREVEALRALVAEVIRRRPQ